MKNRIIKISGKLFVVITLSAILAGAIFARKSENKAASGNNLNELYISNVNRKNFNLGSKFVSALMDAAYLERDENAEKSTIVDLVYLIDFLEGQPETNALQKTLKSIVRGTSNAVQLHLEIENARKSYSKRLPPEQKWYFNSGTAVTNLVFNAYINDNAAMKRNLSEIRELVRIAPQGISDGILVPLNNLTKYIPKTVFTETDYTAVFQGAIGLVNTINT